MECQGKGTLRIQSREMPDLEQNINMQHKRITAKNNRLLTYGGRASGARFWNQWEPTNASRQSSKRPACSSWDQKISTYITPPGLPSETFPCFLSHLIYSPLPATLTPTCLTMPPLRHPPAVRYRHTRPRSQGHGLGRWIWPSNG